MQRRIPLSKHIPIIQKKKNNNNNKHEGQEENPLFSHKNANLFQTMNQKNLEKTTYNH